MNKSIVAKRGKWLLLKAGEYHWLMTSGLKRPSIYRVSVREGAVVYEALFGRHIPQYAKRMTEEVVVG